LLRFIFYTSCLRFNRGILIVPLIGWMFIARNSGKPERKMIH
jgi:hypothetical protein